MERTLSALPGHGPRPPVRIGLNVVEFGRDAERAAEAANINSYQMRASFRGASSNHGDDHGVV